MKIGIDCGHCLSGMDTGAVGNGYKEQDLTRAIGNLVMDKLKALGHTVVNCTCNSANSVGESLNYRVNTADNNNVNLFISIHINAGGGNGAEIYTWNAKQLPEAQRVLNNLNGLGFRNRGIKSGNHLRVVKGPDTVAMLIECFFIDTKADVDLYKKIGADKIANAIVQGVTGQTITVNKPTPQAPKVTPKPITREENKMDKKLIEKQLYSVECSINSVMADNLTIIEKLKADTENLATDLKAVQDLKTYVDKNLK